MKFEVTGDERLTRTFLGGLTDVAPPESSTTAAQRTHASEKAVLTDLPLKQEKAKVTLQLVMNTGNIQIATLASLEDRILRTFMDLERDCVRLMRRELPMDMNNPYSPAIGHFRGQLTSCTNTNSQVPDSRVYNEATAAVADRATKLLDNFPRDRSRLLALLSAELGWQSWSNDDEDWSKSATRSLWYRQLQCSRGITMTRTGRNLRSKTSGVDSLQRSNHFLFLFFEHVSALVSQCPCLSARVKSIRKRGRVRIVPNLSCFVACSLLVFRVRCRCCC